METKPVITLTRSDMVNAIVRNWIDQGFISGDQREPASQLLSEYPVSALACILLESHTARLENMLHYETDPSADRRN